MRLRCLATSTSVPVFLFVSDIKFQRTKIRGEKGEARRTSSPFTLLLDNFYNNSCTNRAATLTDSKAHLVFQGDRVDQGYGTGDGVAWHYHFSSFWENNFTGYIRSADVELWLVALEEWL